MEVNEKELAEWGAEWLGGKFHEGWWMDDFPGENATNAWVFPGEVNDATTELYFEGSDLVNFFFHDNTFAPILAALAKRKMEEMGFGYVHTKVSQGHAIAFVKLAQDAVLPEYTENEYIALWLAIRKVVKNA